MRLFSTEPGQQEQESIRSLSDDQFAHRQSQQDARKQPPAPNNSKGIGVLFAFVVIGTPYCLIMGLLKHDTNFLVGAGAGLAIGVILYWALDRRAWYWREHWLLAREQQRRTTP